jgi:Fe-S-cluster containining protein
MSPQRWMPLHNRLLNRLDKWFQSIRTKYASRMNCGRGCTKCCHGLFDISLPDAFRVVDGFKQLPDDVRNAAMMRARGIHEKIMQECPELKEPYLLGDISEDKIDEILECIGEVRCPLLNEDDACLIYERRPLACILEGIPMVDAQDRVFGDWCELNFQDGVSPDAIKDLSLDYYEIQVIEQEVTAYLSLHLPIDIQKENTLFIPSVIVAVDVFCNLRRNAFKR